MALTTSIITGRVPLPTDENLQYAELTFALSGTDTEGADVLPGGISKRVTLIDSDIPTGFDLWQNTAGLHGTHYRVLARWTVKDRDGVRDQYADLGIIQVGSAPSYTLASLINTSVPAAIGTFWSAISQAQYDEVIDAADAAAADRVATGLDRAQTGLDVIATAASALSASQNAAAAAQIVADIWSFEDIYASGGIGAFVTQFNPASGGLWQEVARTTPVTAAGQRVGSALMSTAAGAAIYAEQATAGNRPYLGRVPSGGRRNLLPNSAGTGAAIGAPGTLPLLWSVTGTTPIREIVATGVDPAGLPYIDVRVTGSPGAAGVIQLCGNTDMPIAAGAAYAWSAKVAVIAGDATNITYASLQMGWRNAGGGFISQTTDAVDFKGDGTLTVRSMSATSPALTASCLPQIRLYCTGAIDITLRISGAQFEAGSARTAAQVVTHTTPLGLDVVEAGVQSLWSLHRSDVAQSLSVTLADMGTSATVMRATVAASTITDGLTIGAGAYSILGANGTGTVNFAVVNRGLTDAEKRLATGFMDRARGVPLASVPVVFSGAVSLADLGYTPASGDVRDMVAAAALLSPSKTVIIPYNIAPWVQNGQWVISGINVEWDMGARVDQRHTIAPGIRLQAKARLVRPYFTSTVYNQMTLVGIGAGGAVSHQHNSRAIWVQSDDCEILDVQMLEFMSAGILCEGYRRLKVTNLTARYLRSYEGYAAACDIKGGHDCTITVNRITDCDRALEPEDGATNVKFIAAPGIIERIVSRFFDQVGNPNSDSFCISCHSHDTYGACTDIRYEGHWTLIDCAMPIYFTQSTGLASTVPQRGYVEHATIINTAAYPIANSPRQQVWIDGSDCDVSVSFVSETATPPATLKGFVNLGNNNRLELIGPDINAALPWLDAGPSARGTKLVLTASNLTVQPTVPANAGEAHLIHVRGPDCDVDARVDGVQHRGYVRFDTGCDGSRLTPRFTMPATNGPNSAVRFNGGDNAAVSGGSYTDASGVSMFARLITGSDGNMIMGNIINRAAGIGVTIDAGAANNAVINNRLIGATIFNGGTGSTVAPNY